MKIERPTIQNIPDSVTEKTDTTAKAPGSVVEETAKEPVQIQRPLPKTDSVEMKLNSFYNFDNAPKLDPSQTNIKAGEVPAAMIPGVPFCEKVELPKTLPNGTSVDGGVGSGDLGLGKTHTGPNHMGIDLKAGGTDIRNQLNDALNLREGAGSQSSAPSAGTVNYTGLAGKPGTSSGDSGMVSPNKPQSTYDAGFNRPGMSLISEGRKNSTAKEMDGFIVQLSPSGSGAADAGSKAKEKIDNMKTEMDGTSDKKAYEEWLKKTAPDGGTKLTSPDAPEGTQPPVVTEETLEKIQLRRDSTTQPGVQEDLGQIDASQLSETDPRRQLISNPNTEDQSSVSGSAGHVVLDAKGPDSVNPNDPQLGGGGEPIVIDPNRPKP